MVAKLGAARQTSRKLRIRVWPMSAAFDIRERPVLECPICRQAYDGQFQVFVPPHYEAFDTVACARRAAEVWGWDKATPVPVILPTIEYVQARSEAQVASVPARRRVAALAAFDLASGQAALATGVGLLAAGTAASIYLWARPGATTPSSPIAAGAPTTRQIVPPIIGPPLEAAPPAVAHSPRTRPAAKARPSVSRAKLIAFTDTGNSPGTSTETALTNGTSGPAPSTSPAKSPVSAPTGPPKPPPSTPKAPPTTPKPPTSSPPPSTPAPPPVNPTGQAEPPLGGAGGISTAGNPAPPQPPAQSPPPPSPPPPSPPPPSPPPPSPPPPSPPPPSPPPPVTPPQTAPEEEPTRPGNGWGDKNHRHTGPPGQDKKRKP
jgi:hypothetical protein